MIRLLIGDVRARLAELPDASVHCVVTSPPYYGLRCYGHADQIGLEATPDEYVAALVEVFRGVRRVLRGDGTLWLNLGDSYNAAGRIGHGTRVGYKQGTNRASLGGADQARATAPDLKPKDLIGIPWRVAFALQADGWWLRSSIIWAKPNPMPESVTDRPTSAHENIFLLTKAERYWYDAEAVKEAASDNPGGAAFYAKKGVPMPARSDARKDEAGRRDGVAASGFANRVQDYSGGRNLRNVWTVATQPFSDSHFATMPPAIAERCIKAGCPAGGTVLDPFGGAGTTGLVADRLGRNAVLIELNPSYAAMAERRIWEDGPLFATVAPE